MLDARVGFKANEGELDHVECHFWRASRGPGVGQQSSSKRSIHADRVFEAREDGRKGGHMFMLFNLPDYAFMQKLRLTGWQVPNRRLVVTFFAADLPANNQQCHRRQHGVDNALAKGSRSPGAPKAVSLPASVRCPAIESVLVLPLAGSVEDRTGSMKGRSFDLPVHRSRKARSDVVAHSAAAQQYGSEASRPRLVEGLMIRRLRCLPVADLPHRASLE